MSKNIGNTNSRNYSQVILYSKNQSIGYTLLAVYFISISLYNIRDNRVGQNERWFSCQKLVMPG